MPLLCALGLHDVERVPRWNEGYYFSRCRSCGRDLVRAASGPWFVPHGYRVVWLAAPPDGAKPAAIEPLVRPPAASLLDRARAAGSERMTRWRSARSEPVGLPIAEVLRELKAARADAADSDDAAREQEAVAPPSDADDASAPSVDDGAPALDEIDPGAPQAREGDAADDAARETPRDDLPPLPAGIGSTELGAAGAAARPVAGATAPAAKATTDAAWQPLAFGLLLLLALIVFALSYFGQGESASKQAPRPKAAAAAATAYVSARIVNCRASPANGAAPVRKLARGERVTVLASEPGWTSVSHRGRQCWISDRYLSRVPPL